MHDKHKAHGNNCCECCATPRGCRYMWFSTLENHVDPSLEATANQNHIPNQQFNTSSDFSGLFFKASKTRQRTTKAVHKLLQTTASNMEIANTIPDKTLSTHVKHLNHNCHSCFYTPSVPVSSPGQVDLALKFVLVSQTV